MIKRLRGRVVQWHYDHDGSDISIQECAEQIIAWVNTNGGAARYIEAGPVALATGQYPLIAIATADGEDYARPGDTIEWTDKTKTFRVVRTRDGKDA